MQDLTFGEQVKIILSRKDMTIKELARKIEGRTGKKMSRQNMTQRLGRDNFQERDMRMIAEILGCPFYLNILDDSMQAEKAGDEAEAGQKPELVTETRKISFDGVECLIYPPQQQEYKEEDNDFSLVISMTYGEQRFLFAGDCEKERLKELLEQTEFELQHDLLKVPHHGRKEKNSEEFLEAVQNNPVLEGWGNKIVVISDGE